MTELSLHILDIAQNSIKAKATLIEITVDENVSANTLTIVIKDNGCGMDKEFLRDVVNPFRTTRTTRKVGLGLSLFKSACELTGGKFEIESEPGCGTTVTAVFVYDSIDRQPLGDMASTMSTIIGGNDKIDYVYKHVFNGNFFEFSTAEIRKVLGSDIALSELDVLKWIEDFIREETKNLYGGALK